MRFWNLLGWIFGIGFIILLIILVPGWIGELKENVKESNEKEKKRSKEEKMKEKAKRNALPQEEKDKITKMHKEGRKRLIRIFGFIAFIFIFPLIMTGIDQRDCPNHENDFLIHIKNIYPSFEPTWYGAHYSKGVCVGYAHGLTERGYTKDEHLYIIRDIGGGKDIYICWDKNQNCSDFDFLTKLKKYGIK